MHRSDTITGVEAAAYEWASLYTAARALDLMPAFLRAVEPWGPGSNPYQDYGPYWNLDAAYLAAIQAGYEEAEVETVIATAYTQGRDDVWSYA